LDFLKRDKVVRADLGEESSFRYDEVGKRWVDKNGNAIGSSDVPPPPPPPSSVMPASASSAPSVTPPSMAPVPMGGQVRQTQVAPRKKRGKYVDVFSGDVPTSTTFSIDAPKTNASIFQPNVVPAGESYWNSFENPPQNPPQ
jgi:hypothetical protein